MEPFSDEFNQRFSNEYRALIQRYLDVKELVAAAEKADPEGCISISAVSELRSALDHIMRVHSVTYDIRAEYLTGRQTNLEDYCLRNLDKALGHVCRAGWDAYDCISLSLIDEIESFMSKISKNALYSVYGDASSEIVIPFNEAKSLTVAAKARKDIENSVDENALYQSCENANKTLLRIRDLVIKHYPEILAVEKEQRRSIVRERWVAIVISLAIGFCVGLLFFFLQAHQ